MTAPTYAQHGVLDLPPFASLTVLEQAAHLVHDHGFGAAYGIAGLSEDVHSDEDAVTFFATQMTPSGRVDWHSSDHDEYDRAHPDDWPSQDPDTGTSNVHRHRP